jgi:cation diffusion facilitator CzcD-associated flavoprotein CzcO
MKEPVVIVGASAAGLAVAACLSTRRVPVVLLEQQRHVAHAWRNHYERLHLHTPRWVSGLPMFAMPESYPRYPGRQQMVDYLESYRAHFLLEPRYGSAVTSIVRSGRGWTVTAGGDRHETSSVVVATGNSRVPFRPIWPDDALCRAAILHSSQYRTGAGFRGQRVLVIGLGNSGGEIAMDLSEHGALVSISVRGAVNVIPRDLFGVPILSAGLAMRALPSKVADALSAPFIRMTIGDIEKLGFTRLPYGPIEQIRSTQRVPLLDIGTIGLIRQGTIALFPGVTRFTTDGVEFTDGRTASFDAIILATGYRPGVAELLPGVSSALDEHGRPRVSGEAVSDGLYFCGFHVASTGMLRQIGIEAERIANAIAHRPQP